MGKTYTTGLVISGDAAGGVKALKTTGREIDRLDRGMVKGQQTARQYAQEISSGSRTLGVFSGHLKTVASLAAGVFTASALQSQVDWADRLQKLNLRIGASTEALSQYNYVAGLSGVQFDALATAWQRQTRRVADAALGTGEAVKALDALNLSAAELSRLRPEQQFERIAAALEQVENPGQRAALAMRLWDTEGVALLQIVNQGTDAIAAMRAEADALGMTVSQQTANDMATFNDEVARVQTALQGVAATLLADLVPGITDGLNATNQFIRELGGARAILDDLTTVAGALVLVYGSRMVGSLAAKTNALIKSMAAEKAAGVQTAQRIAQEQAAIAQQARRTAGEKAAAVTQAQLAQQRAAAARAEAAEQLRSMQLTQQQMAAERALEAQRLQAQISAVGRQQSLNRLAEIRRTELTLSAESVAARRALAAAEVAETSSTRTLSAAKLELARAGKLADASMLSSSAAARSATVAQSALTTVTRGLSASMALLGGPVGVATLAAGAFLMFATNADTAATAADDLAISVDLAADKLRKMTDNQLLASRLTIEDALVSLDSQIGKTAARMETLNVSMARTPGSKKVDEWQRELIELGGQLDTDSQKAQELRDKLAEIQGYLNGERPRQPDQPDTPLPPAPVGEAVDKTASLREQARKYLTEMRRLNASEQQQVANWQADSLTQLHSYHQKGLVNERDFAFAKVAISEEAARRLQSVEDKRWQGYLSGGIGALGGDYRDAQQLPGPGGELVRVGMQRAIEEKTFQGLPTVGGLAPEVGGAFGEVARLEQERLKMLEAYDQRIADYQQYRALEVENAALYDEQLSALSAKRQEQDLAAMQAIHQAQLAGAESTFGSLAATARTFAGEQSGIYKVLFATEKAFSIARSIMAIQTGIAQAAALSFPANLGAMASVAAATANIVSSIASVAMPQGQAHDGIDYVPNTGTWNLQKGERVTGAALNRDLTRFLERENRGGGRSGGSVEIIQNLTIKTEGGGELSPQKLIEIRNLVKNTTYETIAEQMRPGGLLNQ